MVRNRLAARAKVGGLHYSPRGSRKSAEFALATDRFLAPLICRVVRAVRVLGAGLGFPVGAPAVFTPNLRFGRVPTGLRQGSDRQFKLIQKYI